jgi:hypothetical protein
MSTSSTKPVVFISYSHKDEPEHPREGEIQWLSTVRTYLKPAVKHGIFDLWVDRDLPGGADLDPELKRKLCACDVFVLLVSPNSMASDYIVDKEIAIIRGRQGSGDDVHFYPILLTPTPEAGLDKVKDKNIRPRDAKPLSSFPYNERLEQMKAITDEIGELAAAVVERKGARPLVASLPRFANVHISGLPETAYERLVGRDVELKRLDDAWGSFGINVLSFVAEGGGGKSALISEWLVRLQANDYRDAEAVLGWSFYSQGTKERSASADQFLDWALNKLGIVVEGSGAAKGEALADAIITCRILLVLDGIEPLQHGPGGQLGRLKDHGLRTLLRCLAAASPTDTQGLVVLTSRLAVADISRWRSTVAPVICIERLSEVAGRSLLRDNSVWGTDQELNSATRDFAGQPLALDLLASFVTETQAGDIRRRDRIRSWVDDPENPRHDHAKRVMESYERDWLAGRPILLAVMHMMGLFDRPASGACLKALRSAPAIPGLTEPIVHQSDFEWQHSIARLREVRLLAPVDPSAPEKIDAHPLVRQWFGERLRETNEQAWKLAHGRLYEHLRDTTKEGETPTLENLAPLYQAIGHGCCAGRHEEALNDIYMWRICRVTLDYEPAFYSSKKLSAASTDLAAMSWLFDQPYRLPVNNLSADKQAFVLNQAASNLRAYGRLREALEAEREALHYKGKDMEKPSDLARGACNRSELELLIGDVPTAITEAEEAVAQADRSGRDFEKIAIRAQLAVALQAAGQDVAQIFTAAEWRQKKFQPHRPLLYSVQGYHFCDYLLSKGAYANVRDRSQRLLEWVRQENILLDFGLHTLTLGRAYHGLAIANATSRHPVIPEYCTDANAALTQLNEAVHRLRAAGYIEHVPRGLLGRAAFRRSIGDWTGAARDLGEVEEIAELGPMRPFLCVTALERARLAFSRVETYAPLQGTLRNDNPSKVEPPNPDHVVEQIKEAAKQLAIAANRIVENGYHRRDEELAELQAVLRGGEKFADLPPRV